MIEFANDIASKVENTDIEIPNMIHSDEELEAYMYNINVKGNTPVSNPYDDSNYDGD